MCGVTSNNGTPSGLRFGCAAPAAGAGAGVADTDSDVDVEGGADDDEEGGGAEEEAKVWAVVDMGDEGSGEEWGGRAEEEEAEEATGEDVMALALPPTRQSDNRLRIVANVLSQTISQIQLLCAVQSFPFHQTKRTKVVGSMHSTYGKDQS